MSKLHTAYTALGVSLISIAVSQLLIKSRFEHLGVSAAASKGPVAVLSMLMGDLACWSAGVLLVFGAGCWYFAMMRLPIHLMLPLAASIAPAASLGAYFFLGEELTAEKFMAIAVIAIGVAWLGSLQV